MKNEPKLKPFCNVDDGTQEYKDEYEFRELIGLLDEAPKYSDFLYKMSQTNGPRPIEQECCWFHVNQGFFPTDQAIIKMQEIMYDKIEESKKLFAEKK